MNPVLRDGEDARAADDHGRVSWSVRVRELKAARSARTGSRLPDEGGISDVTKISHQLQCLRAARVPTELRIALGFLEPSPRPDDLHAVIVDTMTMLREGYRRHQALAVAVGAGLPPLLAFRLVREAELHVRQS